MKGVFARVDPADAGGPLDGTSFLATGIGIAHPRRSRPRAGDAAQAARLLAFQGDERTDYPQVHFITGLSAPRPGTKTDRDAVVASAGPAQHDVIAGAGLPQTRDLLQTISFVERHLDKGPLRSPLELIPVRPIEHGRLSVAGAANWCLNQATGRLQQKDNH